MLKVKPPLTESLYGAQWAHTRNERIHRTSRAVPLFEEQNRSCDSIHNDGQCRISLRALNTNNFGVCVFKNCFSWIYFLTQIFLVWIMTTSSRSCLYGAERLHAAKLNLRPTASQCIMVPAVNPNPCPCIWTNLAQCLRTLWDDLKPSNFKRRNVRGHRQMLRSNRWSRKRSALASGFREMEKSSQIIRMLRRHRLDVSVSDASAALANPPNK